MDWDQYRLISVKRQGALLNDCREIPSCRLMQYDIKKRKLGDQMAGTDVYRLRKKPKVAIIVTSAILVITVFATSLIFGISLLFKNDGSYKTAVSYIESNQELVNFVGEIQGYGFMPSGSLHYSGKYGQAFYTIKVIGTQNTTYVYIELEKKPDKNWEINYFDCEQ